MSRRGIARGLRGAVAGSVTTTLALAFHLLGGGTMPSAIAILGSVGGTIWISIMIGRRRISLPLLVAAVAASQILLHTIFTVSTADGSLDGTGAHAGHGSGDALHLLVGHDGHAMWWAHALAGLITVLALHRGERILLRLAELTAVVIRTILRIALVAPVSPSARRTPTAGRPVPPRLARHRGTVAVLRGPPTASVI